MFNKRTFNHLAKLYHSVNFINFWVLVFELLFSRARVQIPFQISGILLGLSKQLINVEATLKFKMKILRHACDIYYMKLVYIYSAEGAKNVSWPWLYPLWGWGSLTMSLTGKFVYIYIIYIYIYMSVCVCVCI